MSITVSKLIDDLVKIRDEGYGHARVIIEEQGLGYMGDLDNVNTLMGGDDPTLTLLGERMEDASEVWVVTITHKHGLNTDLFRTKDGALNSLFDWTESYWSELPGSPSKNVPGENYEEFRQAQIDMYFDLHPEEYFDLSTATLSD